jgi:hypothetical protein
MRPAPPRSGSRKAAFFAPKVGKKTQGQVMNAQWQSMPDFDFLSHGSIFHVRAAHACGVSFVRAAPHCTRVGHSFAVVGVFFLRRLLQGRFFCAARPTKQLSFFTCFRRDPAKALP